MRPTEEFRQLLERVHWGSDGGLRYRVHEYDWGRLSRVSIFLEARGEDGILAGVYLLIPQVWGHIRALLAVAPDSQGLGVGAALVDRVAKKWGPTCGMIEVENRRSLGLAESVGYQSLATMRNRTLTRRSPRAFGWARKLSLSEMPCMVRALVRQEHDWFYEEDIRSEEVFVADDLSAGVQICPHDWSFTDLGAGCMGTVLLRALPLMGLRADGLKFGTAHYSWGSNRAVQDLAEHAMARMGYELIVFTEDLASPRRTILESMDFGFVGGLVPANDYDLMGTKKFGRPLLFAPVNAI